MATKPKPAGAIEYVDSVLTELTQQSPRALMQGEPAGVHRARVATRRLAAAMAVLLPLMTDEHAAIVNKSLKRIRRSVQKLRDLDVMQEHLETLEAKGLLVKACAELRCAMATEREELFAAISTKAKLDKWLSRVGFWIAIRGGLLEHKNELKGLVVEALETQMATFTAQADTLAAGLLDPGGSPESVAPHALRIAGKSLRYTFEMAQAQKLGVSTRTTNCFKKLQDALGLWHDYFVLSQEILRRCAARMETPAYDQKEDQWLLLAVQLLRMSRKQLRIFAGLWRRYRAMIVAEMQNLRSPPGQVSNREVVPNAETAGQPNPSN